jgi:hypothetical protein
MTVKESRLPALHAGVTGQTPSPIGYLGVAAVAIGSIVATASWWRNADHTS